MKKLFKLLAALATVLSPAAALAQTAKPVTPPTWARDVVWYQIFVERFANGDPSNDPRPDNMYGVNPVPPGWSVTPWTHNWYEPEPWAKAAGLNHNDNMTLRRFGGDLQGVIDKLDYLQKLGVTALFMNPLNDAPSLHKYDARHYHHIDVNFGPDPAGDVKLMAQENPADPGTWRWTAADKLFLKLVQEVHRRGMRIILDYSWNHTGTQFWAWQDLVKNQAKSPYASWYDVVKFDDPATPQNEFAYNGWANLSSLPEIKKVDVTGVRKSGHPYEGDLNAGAKAHVLAVTRRWLAPDGEVSSGLDGFRLDVADQVPLGFWRQYFAFVKSIQPQAYLVGEIWWEQWPGRLMNPVPYVGEAGVFDAVMFYQAYRPARSFFARQTADHIDARQLRDSLQLQWNRLPVATRQGMMNVAASHDAPRLLTDFYNPNAYKFKATPHDDPAYRSGKPDAETYQRLRLYLLQHFTSIGAPHIWNGDEMGMWGADDPDCRKPLWWEGMKFEPETRQNYQPGPKAYDPVGFNAEHFAYYQQLIRLRQTNPLLRSGEQEFLIADGNALAYRRYNKQNPKSQIVVAFNLGPGKLPFKLPNANRWTNLLTGKALNGASTELAPLSGIVLKQ
jgi:cyclomaltodextrinase